MGKKRCGQRLANDMGRCTRVAGHVGSHSNPELTRAQRRSVYKNKPLRGMKSV
jgi:hypothetical protein